MTEKTTQVRIKKDYYMKGYYSVHHCEYKDGKITSEELIDCDKKHANAVDIKKKYLKNAIRTKFSDKYYYQMRKRKGDDNNNKKEWKN